MQSPATSRHCKGALLSSTLPEAENTSTCDREGSEPSLSLCCVDCFASHFTPSERLRGHHTTAARPRLPVTDFMHKKFLRILTRDSACARLLPEKSRPWSIPKHPKTTAILLPGQVKDLGGRMSPETYTNLIIGSGEGGKFLAWHLASSGQKTAVIERRWIGGSCPNINCLPSKNEIWSAKVNHLVYIGSKFGSTAAPGPVDMAVVC